MRHKALIITSATLALLIASATALAQIGGGPTFGGDYDLSWNTVDGGGGAASGGSYALEGTLGQPDAGAASGGSYTLNSGYWHGSSATAAYATYLPFVRK